MTLSRSSKNDARARVIILMGLTFGLFLASVAVAQATTPKVADHSSIERSAWKTPALDKGRPTQRAPDHFGCKRSPRGCTGARHS